MDIDTEVLVVGGGPSGLTVACELLRRNVPCRVIDGSTESTRSSKAIGLSTRSLEILHGFEAADEAVERGHPLWGANIYSRDQQIGGVTTSRLEATRYPYMLALPQYETESVLYRHAIRLGGNVERGVRLLSLEQPDSRDRVIAHVEGPAGEQDIAARWVVGADGAHSTVRHQSGIDFEGKATSAVFAIVDAEVDGGPTQGKAHYYFSRDGLLVVIPLANNLYRFAATIEDEHGGSETDIQYVEDLINHRMHGRNIEVGELHDAGWGAAKVRIHKRIASRFRTDRCFLVGDAAHIHSPVGGQGVNLAIQDAQNLAWKLAATNSGRAFDALLDTYHTERYPVAKSVAQAVSAQTRLATVRSSVLARLRDGFISRASRKGALDRRLAPQLAQVSVDYGTKSGPPGAGKAGRQSRAVGKRIPDTPLGGSTGSATLHDLIDSHALTLFVLVSGQDDLEDVANLERLALRRYGDMVVVRAVWQPDNSWVDGEAEFIDRDGRLRAHLGTPLPTLCLVRPDAHLACQCALGSTVPVFDYLDEVLLDTFSGSESTPPGKKS